jgi:hypothetical protein
LRPDREARRRKRSSHNGLENSVFGEAIAEKSDIDWMLETDPMQLNVDFELGSEEFDIEHLLQDPGYGASNVGGPATTMDTFHRDTLATADTSLLDLLDRDMPMPLSSVEVGQKEVDLLSTPECTPVMSSPAPTILDNPSLLLLLSTHLRLIEIYSAIFRHIEACVKYSQHLAPGHPALSLSSPQLRIGSYVPKSDAAVCMHVVLLMHLAGKLVENAEGLAKEVQSLSTDVDDTAVKFCNDVRSKADSMAEEIKRLNPKLMEVAAT